MRVSNTLRRLSELRLGSLLAISALAATLAVSVGCAGAAGRADSRADDARFRAVSDPDAPGRLVQDGPDSDADTADGGRFAGEVNLDPFGMDERIWRLSLSECVQFALAENLTLADSYLEPKKAETDKTLAESQYDFLFTAETQFKQDYNNAPASLVSSFERQDEWTHSFGISKPFETGTTVSLTWTLRIVEQTFPSGSPGAGFKPNHSGGFNLTISQSLFKNMGEDPNRFQIRSADLATQIARSTYDKTLQDVLFDVENAYWTLLFSWENVRVAHEAVELADENAQIVRRRRDVGLATDIDVSAAEERRVTRERDRIDSQRTLRDQSDSLLLLIAPQRLREMLEGDGRPLLILPTDTLDATPEELTREYEPRGMVNLALTNREEIKQARLSADSTQLSVDFRNNQRDVDLNLSTGVNIGGSGPNPGETFESIFSADNLSWFIGLELSIPIGGRAADSEWLKTKYSLEQATIAIQEAEANVVREVLGAVRGVYAAQQLVRAAEAAEQLAKEQYEAELRRYQAGLSTAFQVREFENTLFDAQRNLIDARRALKIALLTLKKVIGMLGREFMTDDRAGGADESGASDGDGPSDGDGE